MAACCTVNCQKAVQCYWSKNRRKIAKRFCLAGARVGGYRGVAELVQVTRVIAGRLII